MAGPLCPLFFLSGISGLIYQVIWVREFGNVFGNTVYSSSIVVAIFMLGLGVGSYLVGRWADRRYLVAPDTLLRAYGCVEILVAVLGLGISLVLPRLGALSAALSSYTVDADGWYVLTASAYAARGLSAVLLLMPITVLMGGTLTLLIRYLLRANLTASGWAVALLYGTNTAGAAAGAFLTDFVLVPAAGRWMTELTAVALNGVTGLGAVWLARVWTLRPEAAEGRLEPGTMPLNVDVAGDGGAHNRRCTHLKRETGPCRELAEASEPILARGAWAPGDRILTRAVLWTGLAIALSGFAGMGMEILWLRHFNLLLGGFQAVFSLVLTVVLVGIGVGSFVGGAIARRASRPAGTLMVVQALFVVTTLVGLATTNIVALRETGAAVQASLSTLDGWRVAFAEFSYNIRPMLRELAVPALLMGCAFPLANAVVQRTEVAVGRRAGVLYLANTVGAVSGSLVAGYVLLPRLGLQGSAMALAVVAGVAIVPLIFVARAQEADGGVQSIRLAAGAGLTAAVAIGTWTLLPSDYLVRRSLSPTASGERVLVLSEGVTETVVVAEADEGRALITNNHPMSSTALFDQRYMRALAHIPLLMVTS